MKLKIRAMVVLAVIGLGLLTGAQLIPGETLVSNHPAVTIQPDIYILTPTTASISISTLNGTAAMVVAQLAGDLSNTTIVNVTVVQKDIVTFGIPARGYYAVSFLRANGSPAAVIYTLSEAGQPFDVTLAGAVVLVVGLVGVALSAFASRRTTKTLISEAESSASRA